MDEECSKCNRIAEWVITTEFRNGKVRCVLACNRCFEEALINDNDRKEVGSLIASNLDCVQEHLDRLRASGAPIGLHMGGRK